MSKIHDKSKIVIEISQLNYILSILLFTLFICFAAGFYFGKMHEVNGYYERINNESFKERIEFTLNKDFLTKKIENNIIQNGINECIVQNSIKEDNNLITEIKQNDINKDIKIKEYENKTEIPDSNYDFNKYKDNFNLGYYIVFSRFNEFNLALNSLNRLKKIGFELYIETQKIKTDKNITLKNYYLVSPIFKQFSDLQRFIKRILKVKNFQNIEIKKIGN
jgi:hypothetical protein